MIPFQEVYYRYVDYMVCAGTDEWGDSIGSYVTVQLLTYPVIKHTPKGVWIDIYGLRKFVRSTARKRFACATKEEAYISFLARKKAQIRIYSEKRKRAEDAINVITYNWKKGIKQCG